MAARLVCCIAAALLELTEGKVQEFIDRDGYDVALYRLLGVGRKASSKELKVAYRELSKQYHPDKNPSKDAQERFEDIAYAYKTLLDPETRRSYDAVGVGFEDHLQLQRRKKQFQQQEASARYVGCYEAAELRRVQDELGCLPFGSCAVLAADGRRHFALERPELCPRGLAHCVLLEECCPARAPESHCEARAQGRRLGGSGHAAAYAAWEEERTVSERQEDERQRKLQAEERQAEKKRKEEAEKALHEPWKLSPAVLEAEGKLENLKAARRQANAGADFEHSAQLSKEVAAAERVLAKVVKKAKKEHKKSKLAGSEL